MGHYASEMDSDYNRPQMITQEVRDIIKEFYGKEYPGINSPCPLCGASIEWNFVYGDLILLHIEWHKNLREAINGIE